MAILLLAEHDNQHLQPANLAALAAAKELATMELVALGAGEIHVLLAGEGCAHLAESLACQRGVSRVLLVEAAHYATQTPENLAALVAQIASGYSHVLATASSFGRSVLPRIAALLDVSPVADVVAILATDTFTRPCHAGKALATLQCLDNPCVISIRATTFAATAEAQTAAPIELLSSGPDLHLSQVLGRELPHHERPELGTARVVVAGGRGLGSAENFTSLLGDLASTLGAALGATRAAVDAGYAPNDSQIGQTGRIIAPELYIGIGLSGAIQHMAGVQGAKVVVAINQDAEAPICQQADYVLLADLKQAVPELTSALKGLSGNQPA